MKEEFNELDEQKVATPDEAQKTQEEIDAANGVVGLEQNDNWTFEAEALTLNASVESGDFELEVPEAPVVEEPLPKPTAKKTESKKTVDQPVPVSKNDKIMFTLTAMIAVVLIALLAFLGVRYYTVANTDEKMNPGNVAITVDGTDISVGMYNYYYSMVTSEYISGAGSYYDLDPSKDFAQQTTIDEDGNEISWLELFENEAIERAKSDVYNYNKALEMGLTLSEEQKSQINEAIESLKETASSSDMSVNEYLKENYGDYVGIATVKKLLNQYFLAQKYYQVSSVEQTVTEEEVMAYYEEHIEDYEIAKIAYLPIYFNPEEKGALEKAQKDAKKYLKKIKTEDDMKLLIPTVWKETIDEYVKAGYYENKDDLIVEIANNIEVDITKNMEGFIDEAIDWLYDSNTKINETATFAQEDDGVIYIFMKIAEPAPDESKLYSVRHILIAPEVDSTEATEDSAASQSAEPTKEQWAAAKKLADKVLKEYKDGEQTEMEFAKLAEEYSTDTGSTSAGGQSYGGIYSGVTLGQMVKPFENWATDKSRKYGDVDIVKTDYGYHIMFFIENKPSYYVQSKNTLVAEKQNGDLENIKVVRHSLAMKNTKVAEPVEETQADNEVEY